MRNIRQILRDVWNVRKLREQLDGYQYSYDQMAARAVAWQRYAERGEDRYNEALATVRELVTQCSASPRSLGSEFDGTDAIRSAHAILGENSGWRVKMDEIIAKDWHEKQKAKREAIIQQNATVGIIGNRPTNRYPPKTWGDRPKTVIDIEHLYDLTEGVQ